YFRRRYLLLRCWPDRPGLLPALCQFWQQPPGSSRLVGREAVSDRLDFCFSIIATFRSIHLLHTVPIKDITPNPNSNEYAIRSCPGHHAECLLRLVMRRPVLVGTPFAS